jgi:hypothetical protein
VSWWTGLLDERDATTRGGGDPHAHARGVSQPAYHPIGAAILDTCERWIACEHRRRRFGARVDDSNDGDLVDHLVPQTHAPHDVHRGHAGLRGDERGQCLGGVARLDEPNRLRALPVHFDGGQKRRFALGPESSHFAHPPRPRRRRQLVDVVDPERIVQPYGPVLADARQPGQLQQGGRS